MKLFAVIPSGNRLDELMNLVDVLVDDGVHVIVIDTGYPETAITGNVWGTEDNPVAFIRDHRKPKNIQRWWNLGLDHAEYWNTYLGAEQEFVVAVLNDDIVIEPGFVHALARGIIEHDVSGAFPDIYRMRRDFAFHQVSHWRMSGWAFAMRGSQKFRAREELVWWGGDQDLEWQMLRDGGIVTVGGLDHHHLYPNQSTTGKLAEQAGRDHETFKELWGVYGW